MKAGVFTVILGSMCFKEALDYAAFLGFKAVEIGAGARAGTAHCDPDALLASDRKKDTQVQQWNCAVNGLLDAKP